MKTWQNHLRTLDCQLSQLEDFLGVSRSGWTGDPPRFSEQHLLYVNKYVEHWAHAVIYDLHYSEKGQKVRQVN